MAGIDLLTGHVHAWSRNATAVANSSSFSSSSTPPTRRHRHRDQTGQYLGLTVVHINRVLRSLRADRIVSLEKHWVTILDLDDSRIWRSTEQNVKLSGKRIGRRPFIGRRSGQISVISLRRSRDRPSSIQGALKGLKLKTRPNATRLSVLHATVVYHTTTKFSTGSGFGYDI
jgi:hypothetical protein